MSDVLSGGGIDSSLGEGQNSENEMLFTLFETLKTTFDQHLGLAQFSSLYAETIAYSALITKLNSPEVIKSSQDIIDNIPDYIPLLKQFFVRFGETQDESRQIHKAVEDVLNVILKSDIATIQNELTQSYHPIYHFYETFLKYFKPQEKSKLGVYYTPEPVVKYIVQSTISLLKKELNKDAIDSDVVWLDPAVGTGTFLFFVIDEIIKQNPSLKKEIYQDFILSNIFGFEIQLPSYVMSHLKLARQMENFGLNPAEILSKHPVLPQTQKPSFKPGFRLYLTNSLKDSGDKMSLVHGFDKLTKEVNETDEVKDGKVLVIIGNPPYNGKSKNAGLEFTNVQKYMENYKQALIDDRGNFEQKQNVDNDYIKFIAFATQKIEQNGTGILSMVAGNTFLDSPTMKLVRQELLTVYDKIYITDLHGRILTLSEGQKDENIFEIKDSGVCIFFLIKTGKHQNIQKSREIKQEVANHRGLTNLDFRLGKYTELEKLATAEVFYDEIGLSSRKIKLEKIEKLDINSISYQKLEPKSPNFKLHPVSLGTEYQSWWSVADIFKQNGNGFITHRDAFVIDPDKNELVHRMEDYWDSQNTTQQIIQKYKVSDYEKFSVSEFRKNISYNELNIRSCTYRPFDNRFVYFDDKIVQRRQMAIEKHLLPNFGLDKTVADLSNFENVALMAKRQNRKTPFSYFFVTNQITESCFFEAAYSNASLCPLYTLKEQKKDTGLQNSLNLDVENDDNLIEVNFGSKFVEYINSKFNFDILSLEKPDHKQVFAYIYGFLHDPSYGQKYFEFLQYDFPKINFEVSLDEFKKVAELGQKLIDLHLLKNVPKIESIRFDERAITKIGTYVESENIWYLHHNQALLGVSPEVWDYTIGGYQVLKTLWKNRLKDLDRSFNLQEKRWLLEVVNCLNQTVELLK